MSYESQLPGSAKRLYKETRVRVEPNRVTARASWVCDYADLWTFLTVAAGTPETVNGTVRRIVPLRFPDQPNYLLANNIDLQETGYDTAANTYSKAKITIDFATVPFGLSGSSAFVTSETNYGGNMITLPGSAYQFSGGTKVNQDVGRFIPEWEWRLTYYQMTSIDGATIGSLLGKVNSATITGPNGLSCTAGTLRFDGGSHRVQVSTGFVFSYELSLSFMYRPVSWNQLMKPDGTGFADVTDGSSNPIYATADLTPLLNF